MRAGLALRAARAAVFAALCVLLAAWGHVAMSGVPVAGWAMLLALGGVGAGAWLFAGRERGPLTVMGASLAAQALLHRVFSLFPAAAPEPAAPLPPAHTVHAEHAAPVAELHVTSGMSAVHVVLALLSAVWLWRGERAAFRLLRSAAWRVLRPVLCPPRPSTPESPAPPRPVGPERAPRRAPLVYALSSRGPPWTVLPGRPAPFRPCR
ncbi:hypothetical protein E1265_35040 [Streptomyces sp. 8K308]|uniref:hypothetical protein n=1 Tax=Streptomyces sp. 8K308 TaxID=2530388 RepID=UPI0010527EF7|nr:hypothetical protein [Streptomyces sp. 8K308]TDC06010.1 hypothetical protein E1265_35040 [Streptomyces sp. 8K308]